MRFWYSKICLKRPPKNRQNKGLTDRLSLNESKKILQNAPDWLSLNAGQTSCSNTLTCIKRQSILKTNFGSSFGCLLKTGFTVFSHMQTHLNERGRLLSGATRIALRLDFQLLPYCVYMYEGSECSCETSRIHNLARVMAALCNRCDNL